MSTTSQTIPDLDSIKPVRDLDSVANDLAALRSDLASLMADVRAGAVGRARTMAQGTAEQLADKAGALYGKAGTLYGQAATQADASVKALSHEVEERPLSAVMVAFAVGFVASRLLSR